MFPIPGVEDGTFIVMPLLGQYNEPPFDTVVEVHDFLQQLFKVSRTKDSTRPKRQLKE
jgi:hypothetical protein